MAGNPIQPFSDQQVLFMHARDVQSRLPAMLKDIEQEFDCVLMIPKTPKTEDSARRKAESYNGQFSQLLDLSRATIVVSREEDVPHVARRLSELLHVERAKDRFTENGKPMKNGYRDYLLNIGVPVTATDGTQANFVAEIQVHWKPLFDAKNGVGHLTYEQVREIKAPIDIEARFPTKTEEKFLDLISKAEKAHFSNAANPPRTPADHARKALEDS